jgi:hypothetical protein
MSKRRKNLLDAFRATGPAARSMPPSANSASAPGQNALGQSAHAPGSSAGGPNAPQSSASSAARPSAPSAARATKPAASAIPPAPVVRPLSSPREEEVPARAAAPKASSASSKTTIAATEELPFLPHATTARAPIAHTTAPSVPLSRDRIVLIALAVVIALLCITLWVRSRHLDVSAAQDPSLPGSTPPAANSNAAPAQNPPAPSAASAAVNPPPPALAPGETEDDRAFRTLANKFTVRLAQYDNDAKGKKVAFEAYKYVREAGGSVVQPIVSGDGAHIFLCAGAAPKKDDLSELTAWCLKLRGPATSKKAPFSGAYVDNIDHVLKRN